MSEVKLIETDTMTGAERYISAVVTREQAEATVKWREDHITRRYAYRIVDVQPWMTDNAAARQRHRERHSLRWPMEECGDVDCTEARIRLVSEAITRGK
jgi:hypothetical protein